jgi:hypothetical protein
MGKVRLLLDRLVVQGVVVDDEFVAARLQPGGLPTDVAFEGSQESA